jgi:DNA-binding response OmpR family regulator
MSDIAVACRESLPIPRHLMRHILVAEHDPSLREMLREVLGVYGFKVSTAMDVQGTWEILSQGDVALMLIDEDMCHDGCRSLEQIALRQHTPRVAMTWKGDREQKLRDAGYQVLSKPFRIADMMEQVERLVGVPRPVGVPRAVA